MMTQAFFICESRYGHRKRIHRNSPLEWSRPVGLVAGAAATLETALATYQSPLVPAMATIIPLLLLGGFVVAIKKGLLYKIAGKSVLNQMKGKVQTIWGHEAISGKKRRYLFRLKTQLIAK